MGKTYLLIVVVTAVYFAIFFCGSLLWLFQLIGLGGLFNATILQSMESITVTEALSLPFVSLIMVLVFYSLSNRRWKQVPYSSREPLGDKNVVVTLTAYDDEDAIGGAVTDFISQPHVGKVIVVDDGSTDDTAKQATAAGADVVHQKNTGYGGACIRCLREGLKTQANSIVLSEGDATFMGVDISKFVSYLDDADVVVGTRTTKELLYPETQMDTFMTWGNLFLAKMMQIKFFDFRHFGRVRLTDVGCTMRAIRRDALLKIIDRLRVTGDSFSPHMLMVAISNGLKVVEIPIAFRPRVGASKGASSSRLKAIRVGLRMLWEIIIF
jgi:cellulose synthase/poly-beta-1,6-N-acetylglucosamine synthase-like glycosyltransferase